MYELFGCNYNYNYKNNYPNKGDAALRECVFFVQIQAAKTCLFRQFFG